LQLVVFALVTLFSIFLVRPLLKRLFHIDREKVATNASAMVGRRGKVCVEVNDDDGRVMIDGVDWKAVSLTGERIEQGALVEVVAIDSVILTVKRI
jgi:membrane protein implicated in regulation of membrane protease activity